MNTVQNAIQQFVAGYLQQVAGGTSVNKKTFETGLNQALAGLSVNDTTYVFTDAQKDDIRRFCGYPVFGASPSQYFGYRFLQQYGQLEYILNNLSLDQGNLIVINYLPSLQTTENAILNAVNNIDTDQAAVWTHNKKEFPERIQMFNYYRNKLCNYLGIPPGDYFFDNFAASNIGISVKV